MTTTHGDLLAIKRGIIAHQVNCVGVTGGLAGALRRKYPDAFRSYDFACKTEPIHKLLGTATIVPAVGPAMSMTAELYVMHVFGQEAPGPNTDIEAVKLALGDAMKQISASGHLLSLPVYFPDKMGCGLGGGDWGQYGMALHQAFPGATIIKKY